MSICHGQRVPELHGGVPKRVSTLHTATETEDMVKEFHLELW